jgi:hypothetical protein
MSKFVSKIEIKNVCALKINQVAKICLQHKLKFTFKIDIKTGLPATKKK